MASMKRRIASAVAALLVAGVSAASAGSAAAPVYKIDSVTAVQKPHELVIEAKGAVRTGGWEKPKLRVEQWPDTNTMVVVFVAIPPPPQKMVVQAILPVHAKLTVPLKENAEVTEVRVAGETNSITTKIAR
jgi:hypothetical protein